MFPTGVCPIRRFYVGADIVRPRAHTVRPYKSCQFS
jgi:hypothetical protein